MNHVLLQGEKTDSQDVKQLRLRLSNHCLKSIAKCCYSWYNSCALLASQRITNILEWRLPTLPWCSLPISFVVLVRIQQSSLRIPNSSKHSCEHCWHRRCFRHPSHKIASKGESNPSFSTASVGIISSIMNSSNKFPKWFFIALLWISLTICCFFPEIQTLSTNHPIRII